jgi:hypothetical protein
MLCQRMLRYCEALQSGHLASAPDGDAPRLPFSAGLVAIKLVASTGEQSLSIFLFAVRGSCLAADSVLAVGPCRFDCLCLSTTSYVHTH